MNRRYLLYGGVIVVFIILIILYYRAKKYPECFDIVSNSSVTNVPITKVYVNLIVNNLTNFASIFNVPSVATSVIDYTNKSLSDILPPGTVTNNIDGSTYKLAIYNASSDAFNITGCNLNAIPKSGATAKINMKLSNRTSTITSDYNGNKTSIPSQQQISFVNIDSYYLTRLIILCDNIKPRDLYIYLTNASNQYDGIRINNLTNHIVVINLYNNTP